MKAAGGVSEKALHHRVHDPSLHGDGVIGLPDAADPADAFNAELRADFVLDHRGGWECGETAAAERLKQFSVLELGEHNGSNFIGVEPEVERFAEHGVADGQVERRAIEGLRKAAAEVLGQRRAREERHGGLEQRVADGVHPGAVGVGAVGDDEVEVEECKFGQEFVDTPLAADQAQVGVLLKQRFEDPADDRFWNEV